jgi:hypothetical protein
MAFHGILMLHNPKINPQKTDLNPCTWEAEEENPVFKASVGYRVGFRPV